MAGVFRPTAWCKPARGGCVWTTPGRPSWLPLHA